MQVQVSSAVKGQGSVGLGEAVVRTAPLTGQQRRPVLTQGLSCGI